MVRLWICEICGDAYIGDEAPSNCPFCGSRQRYMKPYAKAVVSYDVELNDTDRANVERALEVEVSNATFYFCAAKKTNDAEGKKLFKILGKVEKEHASVWKKVLDLDLVPDGNESCWIETMKNLEDSHARERRAIEFYSHAAEVAADARVKEIFEAFIEVERDHLALSEQRLT